VQFVELFNPTATEKQSERVRLQVAFAKFPFSVFETAVVLVPLITVTLVTPLGVIVVVVVEFGEVEFIVTFEGAAVTVVFVC
jgi:hypothetical protein